MATKQNLIECHIESYKSFNIGEEISLRVYLTNTSKSEFYILKWNTPFDGLDGDQLKITFEGVRIPYGGKKLKRLDPRPENYFILKPAQRKHTSVDISDSYYLAKAGTYEIQLMTEARDFFQSKTESVIEGRRRKDFKGYQIESNSIHVELEMKGQPHEPFGRKKKQHSEFQSDSVQQPEFIGGTCELRSATVEAHFAAFKMAELSIENLGEKPGEHFNEWFGESNSGANSRFQKVCNNYSLIKNAMQQAITYDFTDLESISQHGDIAYTYFGSNKIYFCDGYKNLDTVGRNSKTNTIIQQYTQKMCNTGDFEFGMENCLNLAHNNPNEAINNADNYEYFSETSVQGSQVLYIFHQGRKQNKQMWVSDLNSLNDTRIPEVGITSSPSVISFMGKLYVFHNGSNGTELRYFTYDGNNHSADMRVQNVRNGSSPSAVVYKGKIYVFHRGKGSSKELWYSVFDGVAWLPDIKVTNAGIKYSPSAVEFNGNIYVFHQGARKNQLWFSKFNGVYWDVDTKIDANIKFSPAAICFQEKMHVFYNGGHNELHYLIWNETSHTHNFVNAGISKSPSVCLNNSLLYCFHEGGGNNGQLWYSRFDGENWYEHVRVEDVGTTGCPGLATAVFFKEN